MKLSRQSNEYEGIPRVEGAATFTNEYRMVGLRQEGRDHKIKRQKPCQDNFSFGRSGRFIWMAVADGVGSESHSQFGARLACDSIAPFLYGQQDTILDERNGLNPEDFSQAIIENARNELIRFSEETDLDIRALSSTLQVVIFDLDVDRITYASIGDGNCIATNSNIGNYVVGHKRPSPMSGTPNLGSHDCLKYIYSESIGCIQDTDQVLLFSDGLDRMFIIPREPGSRQAVGEKPVKYITRILEISENELQALDRIGKFFNVEDYEELIRDDLTLMAIKNINLSSSPVKQLLPADNDKNEDYFGINKSNLESNNTHVSEQIHSGEPVQDTQNHQSGAIGEKEIYDTTEVDPKPRADSSSSIRSSTQSLLKKLRYACSPSGRSMFLLIGILLGAICAFSSLYLHQLYMSGYFASSSPTTTEQSPNSDTIKTQDGTDNDTEPKQQTGDNQLTTTTKKSDQESNTIQNPDANEAGAEDTQQEPVNSNTSEITIKNGKKINANDVIDTSEKASDAELENKQANPEINLPYHPPRMP